MMEIDNIPTIGDETEINKNRKKKLGKILNDLNFAKKKINKILQEVSRKKYDSIPLNEIFKALEDWGIVVLQEDYTEWSGFLCGSEAQEFFDIGWKSSGYDLNGCQTYERIENTCLCLSWHRYESGRYEITTYLG